MAPHTPTRRRGRPQKGHVPLTVYVPPEVRQLIEEEAARADQTLGEVVATMAGDALPRQCAEEDTR